MIMKIKKKYMEASIALMILVIFASFIFTGLMFTTDSVSAETVNITNRTVIAIVNVTNTEPNITAVHFDDLDDIPANEIDLVANNVTFAYCNATVFDYNGWRDIQPNLTNATAYISSVGRDGATDNNHRYRNESCGSCRQAVASEIPAGADVSLYARCDCKFAILYYANHSSDWICNITISDNGGTAVNNRTNLTDSDATSDSVTINKLLAVDTNYILDYGNLSVTQTSTEIVHNVTNTGNIDLNLTLRGYGGQNESLGINSTMVCDFGNISFGNQRYVTGLQNQGTTDFETMINLTNSTKGTNLTLFRRTNDQTYGNDRNGTLWRLYVPLSVGGLCNGTIIFGAIESLP